MRPSLRWLPLVLGIGCAGGGGGDAVPATGDTGTLGPITTPGLEISGSWVDDQGGSHTLAEIAYQHAPATGPAQLYPIASYDNAEAWFVAQNDPGNRDDPELWSRFDWFWEGEIVFLCHTVGDGPTQIYAESANPADALDLDGTGCRGGPWLALSR